MKSLGTYLEASASLGKVGVPIDPVHAVHVNSKPACRRGRHLSDQLQRVCKKPWKGNTR